MLEGGARREEDGRQGKSHSRTRRAATRRDSLERWCMTAMDIAARQRLAFVNSRLHFAISLALWRGEFENEEEDDEEEDEAVYS